MKKVLVLLLLCTAIFANAQKVIPLYNSAAPGSETWNWNEQEIHADIGTVVLAVSKPSLMAYPASKPNGTAIILAPGGGFHGLALDLEATSEAKWLNERGITAFVLKYRLMHDDPAHPENNYTTLIRSGNMKTLDSLMMPVVALAMQDGLAAVKYVRHHASEYGINPGKIGFMGFSAGGGVAMSVAYHADNESRPNFIAAMYAYDKGIIGSAVPKDTMPAFIVAASDDELGMVPTSLDIYKKWLAAKQPAELHVYERGGHGFGMKKQHLPVDKWIDRFGDWLRMHDWLQ
ncbi:MAG: alpha/beta hydrolase [Bacteroidota bacterium]|nr:alpha/beta hydrolase [Bacteroidota bacterium]